MQRQHRCTNRKAITNASCRAPLGGPRRLANIERLTSERRWRCAFVGTGPISNIRRA
jgi:hypothetical protein